MDNEFENIVPWNGANDTGRDVRLKWQRNFERIKANFEEVLKLLGEVDVEKLAKYFIRKDKEDQTDHLVKFLAGLEVGEFIDSLSAGKGTKLFSDGRGQMNILELRKQIQIGEAILFWDDTNKGIGVKRASSPASEDGTGEVKENEIGIYSLGWMSAKGIDKGEEEGSGAGSTTIGGLTNVGSWADQTADYDRIMVQLSGSNTWTEKRLDEIGGGLDEEQLAAYLTENNYAKTGDIPSLDGYATETWVTGRGYITSAALNGYATQSWVVGKGYATTSDLDARIDALVNGAPAAFDTLKEIADVLQGNVDSIDDILTTIGTKADKSISISAGTGLTGGGTLSANRTLSLKPATTSALGGIIVGDRLSIDSSGRLTATYTYTHPSATATTIAAATGKVLSAITVNSLGHVTSVAAKTLAAADIPSLAISKITGLQAELDKKLDKSVLDDLFEKVEIREGVYAIRAKYGLFTNEFLSAKGMDEGSESPGGGAKKLSELTDVSLTNLKNDDLLRWNGTRWVNVPQSSISPSLAWENITGKPSTFPPSAHTHTKSQITDFPATWAWGAISGKPTTVKGYGITDAVTINDDQTIYSSKKWATATSDLFIGYNENGTASVKHIIHTTAGWARGYAFVNEENGTYCSFGAYGQGTTLVYQYVGNNYLSPWQKWNGTRSDLSVPLYVNNYKVWHEGNVGSGSGLNADLLDGVHREGLFTNLGSSTVTKLSLTIGNTTKSLTSLYASHADTVRATACNSTTNSKLWNEFRVTTKNGTLNVYDVYNDGGPTTYGNIIEVVSNVSNHWQPQLWFAGSANGSLYHRNKDYNSNAWSEWAILLDSRNYSDYVKKIGTETVGSGTRGIYLQAGVPTAMSGNAGSGTRPVYLNAGVITQCGTSLAVSVTGNAATATTLQTARTIWGQSFNGSANVSGAISGATTINASGAVTFGSTLAVTGAVTLKSTLAVTGLIIATAGLTTPQYLQVGDGRIYWDATNKALYVKHKDGTTAIGFYAQGWMSAKGVDSGTGGSTGGGNFFGVNVNGSTYRVDDEGYVTIPDYPTSLNWADISGKPSTFPPLAHTHTKSQITDFPTTWAWGSISGKPTTLSGYGITDGVNDVTVSGSGNAVTGASISGHKLTLTKGATFNNYTHPSATSTTIAAATGKVLSAITVNSLGHVTSVASKTLAAADIPSLAISKISGLQEELDKKLDGERWTVPIKLNTWSTILTIGGYVSVIIGITFDATNQANEYLVYAGTGYTNCNIFQLAGNGYGTNGEMVRIARVNSTKFNIDVKNVYSYQGGETLNLKCRVMKLSYGGTLTMVKQQTDGTGTSVIEFELSKNVMENAIAGKAVKLQTARTINGTSFDGSANITTANWGTARNISIQDATAANTGTAVSVNGGANVILKLPATISASIVGNASSATKLQTARTINGTSFDGSANITTSNWGTARSVGIVNSDGTGTAVTVSVNGGANVNLKLPTTIKASLTGNAATATTLQTARTIWGQSFNGSKNVSGAISGATTINASGAVTFGSTLAVTGAVTLKSALSVSGLITATAGLTTPQYLQVGNGRIYWDATNKALYVKGSDGTAIGFYSNGWMSAKGAGSETGGTGGGGISGEIDTLTFSRGVNDRQMVLTNGCSIRWLTAKGSWAGSVTVYNNAGDKSLWSVSGAYGGQDSIIYSYYGGTSYSSPAMVITKAMNVGIGTTSPTSKLHVNGNITANNVSDIRLKTIVKEEANYCHKLLSLGRIVDFYYNDKAMQRNTGAVDKEKHTGLIYQSAKELGLPNFCHTDDDGYGSINYLATDYINLVAGALQQTILRQETIEQRVERLERENEELKRQLNNLTAA